MVCVYLWKQNKPTKKLVGGRQTKEVFIVTHVNIEIIHNKDWALMEEVMSDNQIV